MREKRGRFTIDIKNCIGFKWERRSNEQPRWLHNHCSILHFHHHHDPFLRSPRRHLHPQEVVLFVDPRGKKSKPSVLNRFLWQRRTSLQTLLYFRISRTRLVKASSTLIRCLAEVSINLQPKCLARSRPSTKNNPLKSNTNQFALHVPFMPTWRSYSKSHLFATTMTGNVSWSLTRRICWWNKLISSNELREVML